MLDGEGTGSRLDLPNTGDVTLSRRTSSRDASGMDGGHTARKTSSWCYCISKGGIQLIRTYSNLSELIRT